MTHTLATHRCPLCGWVGHADGPHCPACGHGVVTYRITYHGDSDLPTDAEH